MRRLALLLGLLLALAVGGIVPSPAWAQDGDEDGGHDNAAVAINTKDGSSIFKFAFSVRRVAGDVVDETNAAVAYNECEECRAVAVAIQIVLVVGDPSVVTPGNLALAVNYQCTLCESLAMAYQFVIGVPADFHFSDEALREMARIRKEIRLLRKDENLSLAELRARIDALADDLRRVIRADIERHEERKRRRDGDGDERGRSPPPPPPEPPPPTTTTTPTETDMETFPTITDDTTTETAPTTTETVPPTTTTP